ncbi:MAG: hypothetical protein Q4C91_22580 [Eubacteriales bacterium]|nr:hypothetical protein [Eubacteriales bacterium]
MEDCFFDSVGDSRFNLYLLIIVPAHALILKNISIQSDFQYARKIILEEDQLRNFFLDTFPFVREKRESDISEIDGQAGILNELRKSQKIANRYISYLIAIRVRIRGQNKKSKKDWYYTEFMDLLMRKVDVDKYLEKEKRKSRKLQKRNSNRRNTK